MFIMNLLHRPARSLVLGFSLSFSLGLALAQSVTVLEEVVVTATRSEAARSSILASVEVLNRDDIDRSQATSLADVLRQVAGFEFARNGGPGTVTSFFLRGHNSVNVVLLVDGVRMPADGIGAPLAVDIPLAHVQRIELVRGDASALYGSAANGGVIHIMTRKGAGQYAQVGAGSHGRRSLQLGLSRASETTDVAIRLGQDQSPRLSSMNVRQKPSANPDLDQSTINNIALDLGHQLHADHKLKLSISRIAAAVQYDDDAFGYGSPIDVHRLDRISQTALVMLTSNMTANWRSDLSVSQSRQNMKDWKNGFLKTADYDFGLARSDQLGLRWVNQIAINQRSALMLGIETSEEKFSTDAVVSGYRFAKNDHAMFAGLTHQLADWTFQVNVRHDWLSTRDLKMSTVEDDQRSSTLLGLSYRLSPQWKVVGTASTGFRAATVGEQAYASAPLRPESFRSHELGLVYQKSARDQIRLSYFQADMKDLIAYDRSSNLTNLLASNQGLELSGRTRLGSADLSMNLVVQDPKNQDTGKLLARRAKRVAGLRLVQPMGTLEWSASASYHSQRRDSDFSEVLLRPYATLDLGVAMPLNPNVKLRVSVENATDRQYQTAFGYNVPRRGVFAALSFQDR
jgi:vitamin B12 transporter